MSKTKTKRARREAKRTEIRKVASRHRKSTSSAAGAKPSTAQPPTKKHKATLQQSSLSNTPPKPHVQASQKHAIPFGVYDSILLVGEGDFSFTRSLAIEHGCANVTGTSYDSEAEVRTKYPSFEGIEKELGDLTPPVPVWHGIDAGRLSGYKVLRSAGEREGGETGEDGVWDTIAFMFPHTGGLSTDVNRQISDKKEKSTKSARKPTTPFLKIGGKVIVTLFEGDPYSLWNVRDLARHAGLKVVESFKFVWEDYPGYSHVRTLGAIEGGGGWKGEDRDARMYVFEKVLLSPDSDEEKKQKEGGAKSKKRSRDDSDSEEG